MNIYFDNAATTKLDEEVIKVMQETMQNNFGNPSSTHTYGRKAKNTLENCRRDIARHFGALPSEIIFTSGGSEADNMAIKCAIFDLEVTRIITSEIEHKAVLSTALKMAKLTNVKVEFVNVNHFGDVDLKHLEELLSSSDEKTLVTLMHANNEIGTLLPIKKVGDLCKNYKALFHSDTVQTVGHYNLNFEELGIDFGTCSAHKIHGPKGSGFIYINKKLSVSSMLIGGGQERGLRAGTENLIGITGLHKALELCYTNLEKDQDYILELKNYMKKGLEKAFGNKIKFNGNQKKSLYTVLSVSFENDLTNSMLLFKLDIKGIAVSGGSACNSGANQGSHVISKITDENIIPIRFSFSKFNTKEEVDYCLMELVKIIDV